MNKKIRQLVQKEARELNELVKIRLAPSKIHGIGVFALRDLKEGEKLYADIAPIVFTLHYSQFDRLNPEIRDILLEQFPNIVNDSHFIWPTTRWLAYMNHSEDYNYSAMNDAIIRDVKAGEEITENYKFIQNYFKVFPWLK